MDNFIKQLDDINVHLDAIAKAANELKALLASPQYADLFIEYNTYHSDLMSIVDRILCETNNKKTVLVIGENRHVTNIKRALAMTTCGVPMQEEVTADDTNDVHNYFKHMTPGS